jgi:UDP-2,3-diacylglucosamine hydrolase
LFVSDLHLDAAAPAAISQFIEFLSGPARACEALYVLGDLFEAWFGDDDLDPQRAVVCEALRQLTRSGVPCHVMHGNRDFLLGIGFEARTGCRLLADPTVIDLHGERVLLTHGDALCTADVAYQRLRATVRQPSWQRRFLRLSAATRSALAELARAGSRAHTGRVDERIMDVTPQAVIDAMRACGVRTLIHGHTHRPAVHRLEIDGANALRIVLGAWHDTGSYLRWGRNGYVLEYLARGGPE